MTLREFLKLFNFRFFDERGKENSDTIRIMFDFNDWFEFGIYDFGDEDDRNKLIERSINKKVLDTEVSSIDTQELCIRIWLKES